MRQKAHFFMGGNVIEYDKESIGFKSKNCPAQIKELETLKKDPLELLNLL